MGSKRVFSGAQPQASNGLVQQRVKDDPNGVGYVSLFFTDGVNPMAYNGVACNLQNAKSGQYGGLRNLWMVTRDDSVTAPVLKFINWAQSSGAAANVTGTELGTAELTHHPPAAPPAAQRRDRVDQRVELLLGALASTVLAPDRADDRLRVREGVAVVLQQRDRLVRPRRGRRRPAQATSSCPRPHPHDYVYHLRAWPLLYATALITGASVLIATVISLLSATFIVEFAPNWIRRILEPVVRLLAAVPSVIYGLLALLVIVPFVGNHIITAGAKGVGPVRDPARRLECRGRDPRPHGDDHSDHDRDHRRRAAGRAGAVDGGRRGTRRQPWPALCGRSASAPPVPRSSPPRSSPAPGHWARRSCSRWSRGRSASLRTRSTGCSSSSSRRGRWRRRSSPTPRGWIGRAVPAHDVRVRRGAPRLRRDAVVRRLHGAAGAAEVHAEGHRDGGDGGGPPRQSRSRSSLRSRVTTASPGSLIDRLAIVFAWVAGVTLCLVAGAIVIYMFVRGIQYVEPRPHLQQAAPGGSTRARPGASSTRCSGR